MTVAAPSVKGVLLDVALKQVEGYLDAGEIRENDLADALGAEFGDLTPGVNLLISSWYPAELYDRLLTLMMTHAGGGKVEYLAGLGREAAMSIVATGIYGQLGIEGDASRATVRKILSLAQAMYNFTTWEVGEVAEDGDAFQIVISRARDYPDSFRWRNVGFIEAVVEQVTGRRWQVTSERAAPDRIVFDVRVRADSI